MLSSNSAAANRVACRPSSTTCIPKRPLPLGTASRTHLVPVVVGGLAVHHQALAPAGAEGAAAGAVAGHHTGLAGAQVQVIQDAAQQALARDTHQARQQVAAQRRRVAQQRRDAEGRQAVLRHRQVAAGGVAGKAPQQAAVVHFQRRGTVELIIAGRVRQDKLGAAQGLGKRHAVVGAGH